MNNIYLILGASSEIGSALIRSLNEREREALFLSHYRSHPDVLREIEMKNGNQLRALRADLSLSEEVEGLIGEVREICSSPTHIVHLPADLYEFQKLKDICWESVLHDMELQLHSIMQILAAFLPKMTKGERNGKVLFMLSENTVGLPAKYTVKYTVGKYVLLGLMRSLASDYEGKRINFNAVSPSVMDTKFLRKIDERLLEISGVREHMLKPSEVTPAMEYLLSPASDRVNGQNLLLRG